MAGFLIAAAAVIVVLAWLVVAGFRDGDEPADARVSATLARSGQPDETRPVVIATVRNPSACPVLVGLSVRRSLTAGTLSARVPWRTAGRGYLAGAQDTAGIVPPGESATLRVPVRQPGRRYRLVAVIGQSGRRLRVLTVPVTVSRVMESAVMEENRRVP